MNNNNNVAEYNSELWIKFIQNAEIYFNTISNPIIKTDKVNSLDLVRSINTFRNHRTKEELLKVYPDLKSQEQYINLLWNHFANLTDEELSDLAINMIHDISPNYN